MLERLVNLNRLIYRFADLQNPILQNSRMTAMISNQIRLVRNNNHGAITTLLEQFMIAFLMETMIPDRHSLIDQKAVKFD